jgi:hypothetical protein
MASENAITTYPSLGFCTVFLVGFKYVGSHFSKANYGSKNKFRDRAIKKKINLIE